MKAKFFNIVMTSTGKGIKEAGKAIMKHGPEMMKSAVTIGGISIITAFMNSTSAGEAKKMRTISEREGTKRANKYFNENKDKED